MLRGIRFILAITVLYGAPARAEVPPGLSIAETQKVVEIVDGDTLVLADRRQVRLVGIQVTTRFATFHPGSFSPP